MLNENAMELTLPLITPSGLMSTLSAFPNFINPVLFLENGIIRLKYNSPKSETYDSNKYSRMSFVDPSNHLIKVVEDVKRIINSSSTNKLTKISGLTFKDTELVNLMRANYSKVDTEIILQMGDSRSVPAICNQIDNTSNWFLNQTSLFVTRHVVEHLEDPFVFINQIIDALPESGYILIEVPSSSSIYAGSLFPDFWDEHKSYFELESIGNLFNDRNFEILLQKEYRTEAENVLILVGKKSQSRKKVLEKSPNVDLIAKLKLDFERIKTIVRNYENNNQQFIFVGATHTVINFIDLFVAYPERCIIMDNSEARFGNFATKYSIKIIKPGSREFSDEEYIWLTSISSERLNLYYEELAKKREILNLDQL